MIYISRRSVCKPDRITGLLVVVDPATDAAKLVVNAETWYGTNNARDTTLQIPLDPDSHTIILDAASSTRNVAFEQLPCQQECAGYLG